MINIEYLEKTAKDKVILLYPRLNILRDYVSSGFVPVESFDINKDTRKTKPRMFFKKIRELENRLLGNTKK